MGGTRLAKAGEVVGTAKVVGITTQPNDASVDCDTDRARALKGTLHEANLRAACDIDLEYGTSATTDANGIMMFQLKTTSHAPPGFYKIVFSVGVSV